ncbi:GNAT family N-acetyltransferase [Pantoea sp. Acro-835]|uniref:GNAT family N-acetyltransferase n=2 Tax=Candidatus Pantoea multigeneris TaxID=2608357 RepID=A0ABX0R9V5_9GAMM|nr:GNAT family N-acetyltransferase [Pantoea multigeneris]
MEILLRLATPNDMATVNESYAEVGFVPSNKGELIVLAYRGERIAGQGRVTKVDADSSELGGIYVFPGNEGLGIARTIVEFLIRNAESTVLYCLPFAELEGFYGSMGFKAVSHMDKVPQAVSKKHQWCNATYDKPVLLLEKFK